MANDNLAVINLVLGIITQKKDISKVKYWPQKPAFPLDSKEEQPFPRATPESQGISSAYLIEAINALTDNEDTNIQKLMILRHDKVIYEGGFAPWKLGIWHIEYSMCKSITGMAIGLLIDEGKLTLETKLKDIFTQRKYLSLVSPALNLSVKDLLTMSTGITLNEAGSIASSSWLKNYLSASTNAPAGKVFNYNSMNSYVLSAIVTQITGLSLTDYLKPRLFEPLGIKDYFWEESPEKITKGGWGLFMKEEDAAKLGTLYLHRGKWHGKQIIPEPWVLASISTQIETKDINKGYGYQIWRLDRKGAFTFTGMLGQNVLVYPDTDMVIVTNGGNKDLIQAGSMMKVLKKYFGAGFKPEAQDLNDPKAYKQLQQLKHKLETGTTQEATRFMWLFTKDQTNKDHQKKIDRLNGLAYELDDQSVGLFPIVMQVFHNNYSEGIKSLSFRVEGTKLFIDFLEGKQVYPLEIGFNKEAINTIDMHGEPYLVSIKGTFAHDEDDREVLKLRIAYLEEACTRLIKIFFNSDDKTIELRFNERPGNRMIVEGLSSVKADKGTSKLIMDFVTNQGAMGALQKLISDSVAPVVRGYKKS